jgi:DNA-binding NarL/FixJ family response regulator
VQQPGTQEDDAVPPPEHIRVAVADDAFLMREAISHVLARLPEIELVSVSADGDQLREAVSNTPVDVVLIDIRMPPSGDEEGVKLAHWLATEHPEIGVVLLSQYAEARFGIELLADGAAGRGYLVKERVQDAAELMRTIRVVAHGGVVIDAKLVPLLIHAADMRRDSRLAELTRRERDVLAEMARGLSNAAIATSLVLTKRAVEKHINSIFQKLRLDHEAVVSRRVSAVLLYLSDEGV